MRVRGFRRASAPCPVHRHLMNSVFRRASAQGQASRRASWFALPLASRPRLLVPIDHGGYLSVDQIRWRINDVAGAVPCHDPVVVIDVPQVQNVLHLVAESPLRAPTLRLVGWRDGWPQPLNGGSDDVKHTTTSLLPARLRWAKSWFCLAVGSPQTQRPTSASLRVGRRLS